MLRVEIRDSSNSFVIAIEGRFSGENADYVQSMVTRLNTSLDLWIDLTEVTFVDGVGEAALTLFKRLGATFLAGNSYSLHICERLRLPLLQERRSRSYRRSNKTAPLPPAELVSG